MHAARHHRYDQHPLQPTVTTTTSTTASTPTTLSLASTSTTVMTTSSTSNNSNNSNNLSSYNKHHHHSTSKGVASASIAGLLELAFFHPVDTISKRLMHHQGSLEKGKGLRKVISKEAAGRGLVREFMNLYPAFQYAVVYKMMQRSLQFGSHPIILDYITRNHASDYKRTFGSKWSNTLMSASGGVVVGVLEVALLPLDALKVKGQVQVKMLSDKNTGSSSSNSPPSSSSSSGNRPKTTGKKPLPPPSSSHQLPPFHHGQPGLLLSSSSTTMAINDFQHHHQQSYIIRPRTTKYHFFHSSGSSQLSSSSIKTPLNMTSSTTSSTTVTVARLPVTTTTTMATAIELIRNPLLLANLYRGASWTASRNAVGCSALFGTSAFIKDRVFHWEDIHHTKHSGGKNTNTKSQHTVTQMFLASLAGAVASITVAAPFDVIKVRVQAAPLDRPVSGFHVLNQLLKVEGVWALTKGIVPKLLASGPKVTFAFTVAQALSEWMERF
ncbi:hypothetical protein HDU76_004407 [Blyttiomyces sp. JEL0837]|nr:hypothetical protein HDU76_004407 [Blyttiomyces sp. JEL0837]